MALNFDEIRQLMGELETSSLRDVEITNGEFHLHLSKNENVAPVQVAQGAVQTVQTANETPEVTPNPLDKPAKPGAEIKAPLVGTVYLKPKPESPAFKQVGEKVAVGEQVAIIEAMKLMTPVKSTVAGVITEILVEDEEVVDFDKPLFIVEEG
ncbi:MAG: acetyl-CoA carboxylase, biotin carboxyl carrier protein [Lactobacillaceae bacterium]|jgi:acetyl-CoA carboxylase biotin carboxyl carrier protein|nr:acetyl-CoA carboxylase, biotin carboxyl carrier protein [Lactobacillaceae bacterium]